jgi:hypothetical protein
VCAFVCRLGAGDGGRRSTLASRVHNRPRTLLAVTWLVVERGGWRWRQFVEPAAAVRISLERAAVRAQCAGRQQRPMINRRSRSLVKKSNNLQ